MTVTCNQSGLLFKKYSLTAVQGEAELLVWPRWPCAGQHMASLALESLRIGPSSTPAQTTEEPGGGNRGGPLRDPDGQGCEVSSRTAFLSWSLTAERGNAGAGDRETEAPRGRAEPLLPRCQAAPEAGPSRGHERGSGSAPQQLARGGLRGLPWAGAPSMKMGPPTSLGAQGAGGMCLSSASPLQWGSEAGGPAPLTSRGGRASSGPPVPVAQQGH